jgi:hypothetical protein
MEPFLLRLYKMLGGLRKTRIPKADIAARSVKMNL